MNGPKSWKDLINNHSILGHDWELIETTGGEIKRVRETDDFGGGFGRSCSGGKIIKVPKVSHYVCKNCNIKGIKEHDEGGQIKPKNIEHFNMKCDDLLIKDIIV